MVLADYSNRSKFALPPFGSVLILLFLVNSSYASESPLFADDAVLQVSLTGPLKTLLKDSDERSELAFQLRSNDVDHAVKVRLRGKSRRVVCDFPPFRLNFSDDNMTRSVFAGHDKLKLVTHCKARVSNAADLLQEYAAYRIFNILSDHSYRVRLLRITYQDTDDHSGETEFERLGFLIEPASSLAARTGATAVDARGVSLGSLDAKHAATVFIFQYLIGNTDWSLVLADGDDTCCHNGDLFETGSVRYFVPYDFDRSGLVNARYARPDPNLRISRVTQRLYRGYCLEPGALREALSTIKSRRTDILRVIEQLPELAPKEIKKTTSYVERFFALAEDEEKLLNTFVRRCL